MFMAVMLNNQFELGEMVYLIHDPEQYHYMIVQVGLTLGGSLMYSLQCGEDEVTAFEKELSREKSL